MLLAADAYGGARRCIDMTARYTLTREQFGQPIGAFQAVKHQLADIVTDVEPALSLWWYAAHAWDHIPDRAERHAALAKAHLTDLFDRVTRVCTELHGGIGFTWEYDLHLWFRRAIFDRAYLGNAGVSPRARRRPGGLVSGLDTRVTRRRRGRRDTPSATARTRAVTTAACDDRGRRAGARRRDG